MDSRFRGNDGWVGRTVGGKGRNGGGREWRKAGIGRTALDSSSPMGVGDMLCGSDGGVVDSRFRGNDGWVGMTDGRE